MRTILHILTKPEDDLVRDIIEAQRTLQEIQVKVVMLTDGSDYSAVVDEIFAADSVEVW